MTEAVIAAIVAGVFAVMGQLIIARQNTKDLYAKLDEESKLADTRLDAKLEKHQAVTDTKIDELTRVVREHNNFARRMPVLEEKVSSLERKVG